MDKIIDVIINSLKDALKDIVNLNVKIMRYTNEDVKMIEDWLINSMMELYKLKVKLYKSYGIDYEYAGKRPYFFIDDSDSDSGDSDSDDSDSEDEGDSKKELKE